MSNIENQIVSIKFDNASFEKNLADTVKSLDKLSKALEMTGASEGLSDLGASLDNVDLSGISAGVENISDKFSVMGAIGFSAIQKVTHGLLNMGASLIDIAKTDILGPIISGGGRRAENIEQAKFQFRGLGMDIAKGMASALDAVKGTSFGLDEAARAAAQFGASGIQAGQEMTNTLRGIAGVAAMTNSTFSDIANIFTGAAGMGKITGQDLMQFATRGLNAAAAMGKVLGKTEAEVRAMASSGKISFKQFADAMNKAFGEHATKANETYSGSLANMRAAMSRLGASFLGPKMEQQRDLFNALTPAIDRVASALLPLINVFLEIRRASIDKIIGALNKFVNTTATFNNLRNTFINFATSVKHIFPVIQHFANIIKLAFFDITRPGWEFGKMSKSITAHLYTFSEALRRWTKKLSIAAPLGKSIRRIFQGIFAVFSIGAHILKHIFILFGKLFGALGSGSKDKEPLSFFVRIADVLVWLKEALVDGGGFEKFFNALGKGVVIGVTFIKTLVKAVYHFVEAVGRGFIGAVKGIANGVSNFTKSFKPFEKFGDVAGAVGRALARLRDAFVNFGQSIKDKLFPKEISIETGKMSGSLDGVSSRLGALKSIGGGFAGVWAGVVGVFKALFGIFNGLGKVLASAWTAISTWFKELGSKLAAALGPNEFDSVLKILNVALFGGLLLMINKFLEGGLLGKLLGDGLVEKLGGVLDGVTNHLNAMAMSVKADALRKIAIAIAILAAALLVLSMIESVKLTKALIAMSLAFSQMMASMAILDQIGTGVKGASKIAVLSAGMIALATSMVIMAGAVKLFSMMKPDDLVRGIAAITAIMTGLGISLAGFPEASRILAAGVAMIPLATGIVILSGAIKLFSTMSFGELIKGLWGLAGSMLAIAAAVLIMPPWAMVAAGLAMVPLAAGIALIAGVVKIFGNMQMDQLVTGLFALAGVLTLITAATLLMNPVSMLAAGLAMIPLGIGITILAGALKIFGSMSLAEVAKGLIALAGSLSIISSTMLLMIAALPGSVAFTVVVRALTKLVPVLKTLGQMKLMDLAKGVGALSVMLVAIATSMALMVGAMPGALALMVVSVALLALSKVIEALGKMPILNLVKGVLALAIALGALGIISVVLIPMVPAMIALGIGLAAIGIGFSAIGHAAVLFVTAIKLFANDGLKGIEDMIAGLKRILTMGPEIIKHLVMFVVGYLSEISQAFPEIVKAIKVILGHILDTIIEIVPKVGTLIRVLMGELVKYIYMSGPAMILAGFFIFTRFLDGLRNNIEQITKLAVDIIIKFANALKEDADPLVEAVGEVILAFLKAIAGKAEDIAIAGTQVLVAFLRGVASKTDDVVREVSKIIETFINEVSASGDKIANAASDMVKNFLTALAREGAEIATKAVDMIIEFTHAIRQQLNRIIDSGAQVIIDFINSLATTIRTRSEDFRDAGRNIIAAIFEGITWGLSTRVDDVVKSTVGFFGKIIKAGKDTLESNSPSKVFMRMGQSMLDGIIVALGKDNRVQRDVVSVAENIVKSFETTLNKIPNEIAGMEEFNPTITPVLDLTKVQAGAKGMDKIMASSSLTPSVSLDNAKLISASTQRETQETEPVQTGPTEVKFEQNNYSPTALSTNDIYRNTRSQITLAKEELVIK